MAELERTERCRPRLGPMRQSRLRQERAVAFLPQVLRAAVLARPCHRPRRDGGRGSRMIGRGAGIGRLLLMQAAAAAPPRQVVVKAQLVGSCTPAGLAAHLRYLQRDGTSRLGGPAMLYDAADTVPAPQMLQRMRQDRHHYRLTVAPEDADEYDDLRPFVRQLMRQVARDLGTPLDWIAADHYNTGHPHSHILLRGRAAAGEDLLIARDYLNHGIRARAAALVSLDLGPPCCDDRKLGWRRQLHQAAFTPIDRLLLRACDDDRLVLAAHRDGLQQSLLAGRLQALQSLGMARPLAGGRWRLAEGMEEALHRLGRRKRQLEILRDLAGRQGRASGIAALAVHDADQPLSLPLTGRLLGQGSALAGRRAYLVLDGIDGRCHYLDCATAILPPLPQHGILRIAPMASRAPQIAIAGKPQQAADGKPGEASAPQAGDPRPRWQIEILASWPLERLVGAQSATWLDHMLVAPPPQWRDLGFGHQVKLALAARRQWLIGHGLAGRCGPQARIAKDLLALLWRQEIARLARRLGRDYVDATASRGFSGSHQSPVDLAAGRFILVCDRCRFSLRPWQLQIAAGGPARPSGLAIDPASRS